jgi:hypothetical protein
MKITSKYRFFFSCQKEKVQKDKQRSTKDKNKTKDRVTRTLLKTWVNSGAPEGLSSSCSTSHTRCTVLSAGMLCVML